MLACQEVILLGCSVMWWQHSTCLPIRPLCILARAFARRRALVKALQLLSDTCRRTRRAEEACVVQLLSNGPIAADAVLMNNRRKSSSDD